MPDGLPPQVVFRSIGADGKPELYIAFLFTAPDGSKYPVLAQDIREGLPHPGPTSKLDPSLLLEQRDDVSEEPYYLYLGVVNVLPRGFQTQVTT
jgi:hypothetical protein